MTTPLLAAAVNSTSEAKANVEDHVRRAVCTFEIKPNACSG